MIVLKKARVAVVFISLIFVITGLLASEDWSMKEETENEVGTIYKIMLEGNTLALYKFENDTKELLKSERVSVLRHEDEKLILKGIETDNREEAFMIFEDFVS